MEPLQIKDVDFIKSGTSRSHYPRDEMPQFAFVGRSNVGKSSLLNTLVNRKRLARVSSTPGHTQLINFYLVNKSLYFVDLPGYGFAKAPHTVKAGWEKMITSYLEKNPGLTVVFALFDIRRELTNEDMQLIQWLKHYGITFVAVITKADKLARSKQMEALAKFRKAFSKYGPKAVELFSAETRQGKDELLTVIGDMLKQQDEQPPQGERS